jgi:chromosome partitioning protein
MGVLPTLFDSRTTHAREVLADISTRYGLDVVEPSIAKSVRFAEAPAAGRSILRTAGRTPGAQAYREHARRIAGLDLADEVRVSSEFIDLASEVVPT